MQQLYHHGKKSFRLQSATRIPPQPSHTETPTHIETRTHDQCGDTIEKSQASDDGCINVRNMSSVEEVKLNIITSDIKLVSYFSTGASVVCLVMDLTGWPP